MAAGAALPTETVGAGVVVDLDAQADKIRLTSESTINARFIVHFPFGSQSRLTACVSAAHGARKRSDWLDALVVRRCAIHCAALPTALPCLRTRTLPHKLCALPAHVRHFSLSQRTT